MIVTSDPQRLAAAFAMLASYIALCAWPVLRRRRAAAAMAAPAHAGEWIVAYASQTGTAEYLARQTLAMLNTAGLQARLCSLSDLSQARLRAADRVLFVVSTFGEGAPPDDAAGFTCAVIAEAGVLANLHYGVLALGNTDYENYCAYGRLLDQWLAGQGAQELFPRIEVDQGDADAIESWQQQLSRLSGSDDDAAWEMPQAGAAYGDWRIVDRRELNPGSAGAPVYLIVLEPIERPLPEWESGDLFQVSIPQEGEVPRDYSIASITSEGQVQLLVRLQVRKDGSHGLASAWLCLQATAGDVIRARLREHRRFRLDDNMSRPLIMIGNGTGIAGLRAHVKAREQRGIKRNWLIFGERNIASDFHFGAEIEGWRNVGMLEHLSTAFSRDQVERRYVQDVLRESAEVVREWVAAGAAIYVCGSLRTMAAGVDDALAEILGVEQLAQLASAGRYRRDVY